jgi:hypothetical protein
VPRPGALTIDKIGQPIALSLDPVRCEIDQLRLGPVAPVERAIALWRNELNSRIVNFNCYLVSGCSIEGNECAYEKDGTQERALHVTTPHRIYTGFGITNGEPHWNSPVYDTKMT